MLSCHAKDCTGRNDKVKWMAEKKAKLILKKGSQSVFDSMHYTFTSTTAFTFSVCSRSNRQPPLWGWGPEATVCFLSAVYQSLFVQVVLHLSTRCAALSASVRSGSSHSFLFCCCLRLFIWPFSSLVRFLQPCSSLDTDALHPFDKLEAQLPSKLLEELFGITLLIGRLKDLPTGVQSAFTMSNQGKVHIMRDDGC